MARKTVVKLIDDLDGEEIEGGQTVTFAHQGVSYEIDLGDHNAQKLHDALAPFISAGRKVGGRRSTGSGGTGAANATSTTDREQLQAIRDWGRRNGYKVNDRGRLSAELQEAYHKAT